MRPRLVSARGLPELRAAIDCACRGAPVTPSTIMHAVTRRAARVRGKAGGRSVADAHDSSLSRSIDPDRVREGVVTIPASTSTPFQNTPALSPAVDNGTAVMVGTGETRLLGLRGNSASGKSSVAAGPREPFGCGQALAGQDYLRRIVLREPDRLERRAFGLIDLDAGFYVVVEGILYADCCGRHARSVRVLLHPLAKRAHSSAFGRAPASSRLGGGVDCPQDVLHCSER